MVDQVYNHNLSSLWGQIQAPIRQLVSGNSSPYTGDWKATSKSVQSHWDEAKDRDGFQRAWKSAPVADRREFVQILDADQSKDAVKAKAQVVGRVYRTVNPGKATEWPSQDGQKAYYHATTRQGLRGILKSGRVEVRHEKAYRGAFVSTQPETGFGRYILVFNRNIERKSELAKGFPTYDGAYWAGFSKAIPVNDKTLHSILVVDGTREAMEDLKRNCSEWTGRTINVERLGSYDTLKQTDAIPREWPR